MASYDGDIAAVKTRGGVVGVHQYWQGHGGVTEAEWLQLIDGDHVITMDLSQAVQMATALLYGVRAFNEDPDSLLGVLGGTDDDPLFGMTWHSKRPPALTDAMKAADS
jgi:hypothetical protein